MWTVIKYKSNSYNLMKKSLKDRFGDIIKFYRPELKFKKISKNKEKLFCSPLLDNYVFCYLKDFENSKIISSCGHTVGVKYFLEGSNLDQKEIINFINFCKKHEDKNGGILPNFFSYLKINKAKFVNGPFSNMVFDILEKNKNIISVSFGNFKAKVKYKAINNFNPCFS